MDQESILYCKQAIDRLLMDSGLVTQNTLNSQIALSEDVEPVPVESSENGDDLEEIPSRLQGSYNNQQSSDSVQSVKNNKTVRNQSNFNQKQKKNSHNANNLDCGNQDSSSLESLEFGSDQYSKKSSSQKS